LCCELEEIGDMLNFWFIYNSIAILLIIYLVTNVVIRIIKFIKIKNLKKMLDYCTDVDINLELDLYELVEKYYGIERAEQLKNKDIWYRMPIELLRMAKGHEDTNKKEVNGRSIIERLYFGKFINRLGNEKYSLEVKVKDGIVIGWKELI
jgi:hypothetical protein